MTTPQIPPLSLDMNGTQPATSVLKVGLFGIGLDTYWPQFEGLESRLLGYLQQVAENLQRPYAQIVNIGLVDTPDKAMQAAHYFRQSDVDILFIYVATYA